MESGLYKKYIGSPCKKNGIDPSFDKDFNKLQKVNKTKNVELKTEDYEYLVGSKYKKGDLVSEDDLKKLTNKEQSGEYFTPVGINEEGKGYVTEIKEK